MQSKQLNNKKSILVAAFFVTLLLFSVVFADAEASEASEKHSAWIDAKESSREAQTEFRKAKQQYGPNSDDAVDSGKDYLHAVLNEAEAWLLWKQAQADENTEIPDDLRDDILNDVEANLAKIDSLRDEVDAIENNLGLGVTFLRMIGKYSELLADVARDSGKVWVFQAEKRIERLEEFKDNLEQVAINMENIDALNDISDAGIDIGSAKNQLMKAEDSYDKVRIGTTPLVNFNQGNQYLRACRADMLRVHAHLNHALGKLIAQE